MELVLLIGGAAWAIYYFISRMMKGEREYANRRIEELRVDLVKDIRVVIRDELAEFGGKGMVLEKRRERKKQRDNKSKEEKSTK